MNTDAAFHVSEVVIRDEHGVFVAAEVRFYGKGRSLRGNRHGL